MCVPAKLLRAPQHDFVPARISANRHGSREGEETAWRTKRCSLANDLIPRLLRLSQ